MWVNCKPKTRQSTCNNVRSMIKFQFGKVIIWFTSWLTASDRVRRQAVYNLYNKEETRMFHFSNRHHHTGKTSMSRAKVYGLLMALAMLFMAGLCACSAQPHSAAETAPQTIVVGIDVLTLTAIWTGTGSLPASTWNWRRKRFHDLAIRRNSGRFHGRTKTTFSATERSTVSGHASA